MQRRRKFITKALATLGLAASYPLIARPTRTKQIKGRFVHMVFFWLKESTDTKIFMRETASFIEQINVVKAYHLGNPAMTPREVVDNSYTVSLVVTFDTKEAHDTYQDHPIHKNYVQQNKGKWTKVQIYDSWGMQS